MHLGKTEPRNYHDYLTINVLPALTTAEYSEAILKSYGGWLNLIATFIVGLLGVYTGKIYYKPHKQ
jgi:hypothetical protein